MAESRVDKVLKWTCVAGYFTVWVTVLSSGFTGQWLAPAVVLACTYAGMHYFEMAVRGHLALSADSTAIPVAFGLVAIGALAAHFGGVAQADIVGFVLRVPAAWIGGHAAVFGLVFLMDKLGIDKPDKPES